MDPPPNNDNDDNNANADNDAVALGIAAAMAVDEDQEEEDVDADEAICQEAITLLQNRLTFHSRLRDRTMVQFARQFVTNVKEDIYQTITDTRIEEDGYDGLDSERDTEEEVATAIRCCPEVLTQLEEQFELLPIQCLTVVQDEDEIIGNVKAVSFIPLFARLAIEFRSFGEHERGGLLMQDGNDGHSVLHALAYQSDSSRDEEYQQGVDTTFLAVLIRLRRSGFFVKNDIQQYNLVNTICLRKQFSVRRFRFLIEWDPSALLQTDEDGSFLPLHWVADNLQAFQVVLDSLFRYYPRWRGINALFQKDIDGDTPFQLACESLPRTKVMEVVEEILARYTTTNGLVNTTTTTTNNNGNAIILAASEDTMSLDGLYFLIRRQPDTMLSMLRHRNNDNSSKNLGVDCTASEENGTEDGRHNKNYHNTGDTNNGDDHDSNTNHNSVTVLRRSTRKRKR